MLWLLLTLAVAAAYYRWSRRRLYRLAREIPAGITGYPVVGHAYLFSGTSEDRMKAWQTFGQIANQQGGLSSFWLGNRLYIAITDPNDIELVSRTCLDKDEFMLKFARTFLGNGSVVAPVNIWHLRRKMLSPFFKLKNLKHIVNVFHEQSSIMGDLLQSEVGRGDFPIWTYFARFTFDTTWETTFGVKINSQVKGHWVLDTIDMAMSMITERMLQPWLHPDLVYKRMSVYQQLLQRKQRLYDYIKEVLSMKRKKIESEKSNSKGSNNDSLVTFVATAILAEKGYTDTELMEETMTLVAAGTDTSAVGSCFTSVILSRYPDVQERVYQEVREVFGASNHAVTVEDLARLKYLEAVIKESLRLYPPAPIIAREVHDDVQLPSGTTLVPGTSVIINIWGTHRNPQYWGADAEQFRPERFLEEPLPHPAQFIPFSYSVRDCIGSTYAMLSTKTALANLLRRYRLLPPSNMAAAELRAPLPVKYVIMMKAVDDFVVRLEERK